MSSSETEKTHDVTIELPRSLERQVARVIIAWACLEWHITQAAHALVGVGPQTGRIAIREPRMTDRIALVQDLIDHLKVRVDFDFKSFKRDAGDLAERRDWLAHGISGQSPANWKGFCYDSRRGNGKRCGKTENPEESRRSYPQGLEVTAEDLKTLRLAIEHMICLSDNLTSQVVKVVETLPAKRP